MSGVLESLSIPSFLHLLLVSLLPPSLRSGISLISNRREEEPKAKRQQQEGKW